MKAEELARDCAGLIAEEFGSSPEGRTTSATSGSLRAAAADMVVVAQGKCAELLWPNLGLTLEFVGPGVVLDAVPDAVPGIVLDVGSGAEKGLDPLKAFGGVTARLLTCHVAYMA